MRLESKDITDENIKKILELFPNVATEAKDENGELKTAIDFEKLKQELSKDVVDGEECYDFTWVGKKEAIVEANRPIRKTLRPCRDKSLNWEDTENIYIEGDNLEALKLLQESYLGKVKMIYIDPPYNTGNDFIYNDSFAINKDEYEEEIEYKDEDGNIRFKKNEISNPRYHSDWCSMIYSRLKLAMNLLSNDGVIFISIDDNEVDNLRSICNEIFGEENFVANVIWQQGRKSTGKTIAINHEYCLIYSKNLPYILSIVSENNIYWKKKKDGLEYIYNKVKELRKKYNDNYSAMTKEIKQWYKSIGEKHPAYVHKHYNYIDERGIYFPADTSAPDKPETRCHKSLIHPITNKPTAVPSKGWRWKETTLDNLVKDNRIHFGVDETSIPCVKRYLHETEYEIAQSVFYKDGRGASQRLIDLFGCKVFDFPKDENIISEFINYCIFKNENSIILDFFSGSATTAHACMQLNAEDGGNRKFIMVQLPEKTDEKSEAFKAGYKNICEIGEERIRRAGQQILNQVQNDGKKIDVGFRVFKVDDTNMKNVYYSPNETDQKQLGLYESNIKDDRTDEDLLYGCLLDWGVELSLPHRVETIDGKRVHIVDEDALVACFEENIPESVIRKIAGMKPLRVVFRDSSFNSDDNKINVEEIFKLITPDTRVKVI